MNVMEFDTYGEAYEQYRYYKERGRNVYGPIRKGKGKNAKYIVQLPDVEYVEYGRKVR